MGRKRKKKRPGAKRRPFAAKARARPDELRPEPFSTSARRRIGVGLDIALAALCILFLAQSVRYAAGARFFTDECFHTYIVEGIAQTGNSPARLGALYSDMRNNTHPLFHWLGAPLYLVGGRAALPYLSVILCGAMLGLLYWLLRAWVSPAAARIAVSIVLLFSVVHVCTQIFYMEILSALCLMVATLALTFAVGRTDWKLYFLAGIACALTLLSKQTGYALIPVIVLCGLYFLVVQRWRHALGIAIVAVTFAAAFAVGMNALAKQPLGRFKVMYLPIERDLVPKPLRLFSSIRPMAAVGHSPSSDLQPAGGGVRKPKFDPEKALKSTFGRSPEKVLESWVDVVGPFGLLLAFICLAHLFVARRQGVIGGLGATAPLVLTIVSLVVGAMCIGTVDKRHFISCIPVLAGCAGIALADLLGRFRGYRHVVIPAASAVLIVSAAVAVARVPNYREPNEGKWWPLGCNVSEELVRAARAIAAHDPHKRPVLSMWTSSTWYYSGHPTTWAGVNVPRLNSVMFETGRWAAFGPYWKEGIRYFLIDNRGIVPDAQYAGLGYTETFFRNIVAMLRSGVMQIIYPSPETLVEYQRRNPRKPIWGNPEIPYIVVEFDQRKFLRPPRPNNSPAGPWESPER